MMVNAGKSKVFKWKMTQLCLGLFDGNIAAFDFFQ
jgi:hypothetical protein